MRVGCEESWAQKNWCLWTVVLEKTLESPLDCKEIQPVHSKGDQSWVFFGRTDARAETPILLATSCEELTHWKRLWCWEGLGAGGEGEKGTTEDEMARRHHRLDGREFEWTLGAAIHGVAKSWTRLSDWTKLNWSFQNPKCNLYSQWISVWSIYISNALKTFVVSFYPVW